MRTFHFASTIALMVVANPAAAAAGPQKVYPVLFEVAHNERGQLVEFKVNRVLDPASGKTDAVKLTVPQLFVDGARGRSLEPKEMGKADRYFTFYVLDPQRPTDLFIDKY